MACCYVFLLVLLCSGCGSCLDNDCGPSGHIYGGVKADAQLFQRCVGYSSQVEKKNDVLLNASFALFAVIDTPASFIVDTLLLPNAIYETYFRTKPGPIPEASFELTGGR